MAIGMRYREWIARYTAGMGVLRARLGSAFVGVMHGLMADSIAEGASLAVTSPWMTLAGQPDDALPVLGKERKLPRYRLEPASVYRPRLLGAWSTYEFGGTEDSILSQLTSAGYPGVAIFDPGNADFLPSDYYSHFIVYFPVGTHTVTAAGPTWGSFSWGDGTLYGPVGLIAGDMQTIRAVIAKWKSAEWICRRIKFQISGWAYGTGRKWGEPGLKFGGLSATIGP